MGDGDDIVFALDDHGRGNDRIFGEGGRDRLHGGRGDDTTTG